MNRASETPFSTASRHETPADRRQVYTVESVHGAYRLASQNRIATVGFKVELVAHLAQLVAVRKDKQTPRDLLKHVRAF